MRTGISIAIAPQDRRRLEAVIACRNAPQKHVWRCRIMLFTADGLGTNAIMREAKVAKTAVWRWQERFMHEGVDGLLRDKTRPSRVKPLGAEVAERATVGAVPLPLRPRPRQPAFRGPQRLLAARRRAAALLLSA